MKYSNIHIKDGASFGRVDDIIQQELQRNFFGCDDTGDPKDMRTRTLGSYSNYSHAPVGLLLLAASQHPFDGDLTDEDAIEAHLQGYLYAPGDPDFAKVLNRVIPEIYNLRLPRTKARDRLNRTTGKIDVAGTARRLVALAATEPDFVRLLLTNDLNGAAPFGGRSTSARHREAFDEVFLLSVLSQAQAVAAILYQQIWQDHPLYPQLKRSPALGGSFFKWTDVDRNMAAVAYDLFQNSDNYTHHQLKVMVGLLQRYMKREQITGSDFFSAIVKRLSISNDEVEDGLPPDHAKLNTLTELFDESLSALDISDAKVNRKTSGGTTPAGQWAYENNRKARRIEKATIEKELKRRKSLPRSVVVIGDVPSTALAFAMAQLVWIISQFDIIVDARVGGTLITNLKLQKFRAIEKRAVEALFFAYSSVITRGPYHVPTEYKDIRHLCSAKSLEAGLCKCWFIEKEKAPVDAKHRYAFGAGLTIEDKISDLNPFEASASGRQASRHGRRAVVEALALLRQRKSGGNSMTEQLGRYVDLSPFAQAFPLI